MAKLSRGQLKSIVKDCLLEILAEGLANDSAAVSSALTEAAPRRPPAKPEVPEARNHTRRVAPDLISFGGAVEGAVRQLTEDPIMSSIFEDTAKTTLQNQLQEEGRAPSHLQQIAGMGDLAARTTAEADPMDMFGEASANWAAIAFADGKAT